MTQPIARDAIYRKRVLNADIIELCVRSYITSRLSYRDLVEMMAERGIESCEKRQAHDTHREISLEPWSVFDACQAKLLIKLQSVFAG
jgi:transposase-like protein